MSIYICVGMWIMEPLWWTEDNLSELVFSLHQVDSGSLTQSVRLGGKLLYPLSQLAGPAPVS